MDDSRTPAELSHAGPDAAQRRRATRITALVFGGIAIAIYAGFILSGVLRA